MINVVRAFFVSIISSILFSPASFAATQQQEGYYSVAFAESDFPCSQINQAYNRFMNEVLHLRLGRPEDPQLTGARIDIEEQYPEIMSEAGFQKPPAYHSKRTALKPYREGYHGDIFGDGVTHDFTIASLPAGEAYFESLIIALPNAYFSYKKSFTLNSSAVADYIVFSSPDNPGNIAHDIPPAVLQSESLIPLNGYHLEHEDVLALNGLQDSMYDPYHRAYQPTEIETYIVPQTSKIFFIASDNLVVTRKRAGRVKLYAQPGLVFVFTLRRHKKIVDECYLVHPLAE
jgi:hypothetical protein